MNKEVARSLGPSQRAFVTIYSGDSRGEGAQAFWGLLDIGSELTLMPADPGHHPHPAPPPHAGGERVRPGESESGCSGFAPCGRKQPGCLDALQTVPSGRYIDDIVRMYDTVRTSTSGRPTPSLGKTHALQSVEESPYRDSRTHHVRGAGDVQRLRDEPRRPFQSKRRMAASSVPPTQKESRPGVRSQASPSHAGRTALTRALSGAGDRQL